MKLIYLDIDGVLNDRPAWPKGPELQRPQCECLHRIIHRTGAKIILTSSWRAWIADGSMTLVGFSRLLQTHGVSGASVIGYLPPGPVDANERSRLIAFELASRLGVTFIVLDDLIIRLDVIEEYLIQTDGHAGLNARCVERACQLLGEQ